MSLERIFDSADDAIYELRTTAPGPSGRFTLIPTENIWTFILPDQVDGRTWYVQWGENSFI